MDTISRENNNMLPVGAIIVGVIALVLGGFAAIKVSGLQKTLAENQAKIDKIESIESSATSAAAAADKANRELATLQLATRLREIQENFTQVGAILGELKGTVTRLDEAAKKPAVAANTKKGGEPVVAGPNEYVVKAGDSSGTKIAKDRGIPFADLQAVNPGIDWNKLKIGQKLKLPTAAKK